MPKAGVDGRHHSDRSRICLADTLVPQLLRTKPAVLIS
jgi:hypothetical protein